MGQPAVILDVTDPVLQDSESSGEVDLEQLFDEVFHFLDKVSRIPYLDTTVAFYSPLICPSMGWVGRTTATGTQLNRTCCKFHLDPITGTDRVG